MKSINKIFLSGHVGGEPEFKSTPTGVFVLNFNIAVNFTKKTKDGQKEIETDWHLVRLYGKLAEIMQQYIKKGTHIFVEGVYRATKYQDKNGQQKYFNFIVASDVTLLDSKKQEKQENQDLGVEGNYKPYGSVKMEEEIDDDIPF